MKTFVALAAVTWLCCHPTDAPRDSLLIAGNAALVHYLQPLVKDFESVHPDVRVVVEPGGTTASLIALKRGAIDVAALSRLPSYEEDDQNLRDVELCRDGLAIVVHKDSPVSNLSRHQLEEIFEGNMIHWENLTRAPLHLIDPKIAAHPKTVMKPHHKAKVELLPASLPVPLLVTEAPQTPIAIYVRDSGTPTSRSFSEMVLGGDEPYTGSHIATTSAAMVEALKTDPTAIGYLSLKHVTSEVKELKIDGVEMNRVTMLSGRYPLSRAFFLATYRQPSKLAQTFVDFALSARGQEVLEKNGLLPVR